MGSPAEATMQRRRHRIGSHTAAFEKQKRQAGSSWGVTQVTCDNWRENAEIFVVERRKLRGEWRNGWEQRWENDTSMTVLKDGDEKGYETVETSRGHQQGDVTGWATAQTRWNYSLSDATCKRWHKWKGGESGAATQARWRNRQRRR